MTLIFKKLVHTLAVSSQQSGWEERLKNLIKIKSKAMERCLISIENLNDMLKELMRKYRDGE